MVNLVTVPGVELMRTGKWSLSSGEWECTPEVIAATIAAHDAQVLRKPVIRLGHNDPRFSGDPAVGWIDNLRTADDGNTLVGDMVGVPEWLADIMPSAYPSRSVEGMHSYTAPDGSEHGFVLTGLALLGATKPGVESLKSLQDVAQLYDVAAARQIGGTAIEFTVTAAADAKKPYGDVDYADPGYQADGVHRYPLDNRAHVKAAWDLISMGGHADAYSSQQLTHIKRRIREAAAKFGITIAAAAADEGNTMPLSKEVAARLGVGEDATEADILAAIGRVEAAAPPKPKGSDDDESDEDDDEDESGDRKPSKKGAGGPNPSAGGGKKVSASGEAITLEPGAYKALVEAAAAGQRAEARQIAEDQAKVVDAAIAAGKVPPARRDHWIAAMAADPEGSTEVLAGFAPGLVPVAPIGHALSDESSPEVLELNDIHNRVMASFGITPSKKAGN